MSKVAVAKRAVGSREWGWTIHVAIPLILSLAIVLVYQDSYLVFLATSAAVTYVLVASFNLVFGYGGIFSLASVGFFGIGAYASVYAENHWNQPFWVSFPFAILVAAVAGAILIIPTSHLKDIFIAIVTLGFAVTALEVFAQWDSVTGGAGGIYTIEPPSVAGTALVGGTAEYLIFCGVFVWIVAELTWGVARSGFGRKLAALRETPHALSASGIDAGRVRFSVFVLSSGLAGLAGALYAHFQLTISPETFSFLRLIELLLATVIGGAGTFLGPVVGVLVLAVIDEFGIRIGDLEPIVYGVAVVVLMTVGRHGVVNLMLDLWNRWLRRSQPSSGLKNRDQAADRDVSLATTTERAPITGTLLTIEGVTVRFGGVHAVSDVSLQVESGEIVGLVGPNGAGKTSLFNAITGEVSPVSGVVRLNGETLVGVPSYQVRRRGIARTFQQPSLVPELSLLENVMLGGESRSEAGLIRQSIYSPAARRDDAQRRDEAAALLLGLGLGDRAFGRAAEQPYGVQRLAEIARSLMLNPMLLMLDEPGAGLSDAERGHLAAVLERLRRRQLTVILIDHNVSFVSGISDRMVVMGEGQIIAEGEPQEVLRNERVIGAYLGSEGSRG